MKKFVTFAVLMSAVSFGFTEQQTSLPERPGLKVATVEQQQAAAMAQERDAKIDALRENFDYPSEKNSKSTRFELGDFYIGSYSATLMNLMVEVKNIGDTIPCFINLTIDVHNSDDVFVDSDYTYVWGAVRTLPHTQMETNTCLRPGERGFLNFFIDPSGLGDQAGHIHYTWDYDIYNTSVPDAEITLLATPQIVGTYSKQVKGQVKNIGRSAAKYVQVACAMKNGQGDYLDIAWGFIDGDYVDGTDTGLRVNSIGDFSFYTSSTAASGVRTFFCKTDWWDYGDVVTPSCTYSLSRNTIDAPASGDTGSIRVTTDTACTFTFSSPVSWVTLTRVDNAVNYSVAANTGTSSRSTTLTIAGHAVTVTQAGAETPPSSGLYSYYVVGVVQVAGAMNSMWKSSLVLRNLSENLAEVELAYSGDGHEQVETVVLQPSGIRIFDNPVYTLFGLTGDQSGVLEVISVEELSVFVRTYNETEFGTFGQLLPGVSIEDAVVSPAVLAPLRRTEAFRTNVGAINMGSVTANVKLSFVDSSGAYIGDDVWIYDIAAEGGWKQKSDVLRIAGLTTVDIAYAEVYVSPPNAKVWVYGSLIDNESNDPAAVIIAK